MRLLRQSKGRGSTHTRAKGGLSACRAHATFGAPASALSKHFNHTEVEPRVYTWWEQCGFFAPESAAEASASRKTAEPFVVPMPPPNVTGVLHMGHALCVALQDCLVRHRRMEGYAALYLPGTDHAGIATQQVVEQELATEGISRLSLGREQFEQRVWQWKARYGNQITCQLRSLGTSCDWSREVFTLDERMSAAVAEAFVQLHSSGLVYRGEYMVNWSPSLRTALSDLEVEFYEETASLYYLLYPARPGSSADASSSGTQASTNSWTHLPVATSRPETILGDTGIAVNPHDERFNAFVGGEAEVPLTGGRTIPIIADESVEMEFGTGCLKVTPAHDKGDHALGKAHNLETIQIMDDKGCIRDSSGASGFDGLERFECRQRLWSALKDAGLAQYEDTYTTKVPRSQRSGEVIEPMVSMQWFVQMGDVAKQAANAVRNGDLSIVPSRFERTWFDWLDNIEDWCVSRQLWWGHRIPAWYVRNTNGNEDGTYVIARSENAALSEAQMRYGDHVTVRQDEDVLDTWFSSSLWPFSTVGWPDGSALDLQRFYPASVLETGHDILFFWVARMVMMGQQLTGQLPFNTVFLHGIVRDGDGKKMSKSLGNAVDPLQTIEDIGADALRFTLVSGTSPGFDLNLSDDKLSSSRSFANKVYNLGKYLLFMLDDLDDVDRRHMAENEASFTSPASLAQLSLHERWIVCALHSAANAMTENMRSLELADAARRVYDFIYDDLADWFVEASKADTYGTDKQRARQSKAVLMYCLETSLRLLHPFMPFVTEEVWQSIPHIGTSIMLTEYPGKGGDLPVDGQAIRDFQAVRDVVRSVRNVRADYGMQSGKRVPCTIHASDAEGQGLAVLQESLYLMDVLCKMDVSRSKVVGYAADRSDESSVQAVVQDTLEVSLPLTGLADPEKEVERLRKQQSKLEKDLQKAESTLQNENFIHKAPENVVEKTREEARQAREQLKSVNERIERMEKLGGTAAT